MLYHFIKEPLVMKDLPPGACSPMASVGGKEEKHWVSALKEATFLFKAGMMGNKGIPPMASALQTSGPF